MLKKNLRLSSVCDTRDSYKERIDERESNSSEKNQIIVYFTWILFILSYFQELIAAAKRKC